MNPWAQLWRAVFGIKSEPVSEPEVCVTHLRFLPCRRCDQGPGPAGRWSANPDAIEAVRVYQNGEADR